MNIRASLSTFAMLILTLLSDGALAAKTERCLQSPSRTEQCNNLVYRGAQNPKTGKQFIFCFCRADMEHLLNENLPEKELALNKMEWRQLLAETGYTDEQLKRLISK